MESIDFNKDISEEGQGKYTVEDWLNISEDRRVELIDGLIYDMATPTRIHQGFVMGISSAIHAYIQRKGGECRVYPAPFSVQLNRDEDTIVEPDISVICDKNKLTDKGCIGAPDWIIEIISPSTASMDYVKKRELYMNSGVREYWIVNPETGDITVYTDEHPFIPKGFRIDGPIRPRLYEDFVIDFREISKQI